MTALRTLVEIAERGDSDSARVATANALLDRAWGKAAVPVVGTEMPPTITLNFGTELRPPNHANEDAARTIEAAPSRLLPVIEEEE
jgi:hypothetical protein